MSTASDGFGSGLRSDPRVFLSSGVCLLCGAFLALYGRRGWKATTGLSCAYTAALIAWAVCAQTATLTDYGVFGLSWGAALLAGGLGATLLWALGWLLIGACGGMSFAVGLLSIKSQLLIPILGVRFALIAVFGIGGLIGVVLTRYRGAAIATSILGTFLFAFGLDLLVNEDKGLGYAVRAIFDNNASHSEAISPSHYNAPLSTSILLSVSWLAAFAASWYQMRYFQGAFFRTADVADAAVDYTPPYRTLLERRGYGATTLVHPPVISEPRSDLKKDLYEPPAVVTMHQASQPDPMSQHETLRTPTLAAACRTLDPLRRSVPIPYVPQHDSFRHDVDSFHGSYSSNSSHSSRALVLPPRQSSSPPALPPISQPRRLPNQQARRIMLPSEAVHASRQPPNPPRVQRPAPAYSFAPPRVEVQCATPEPVFRYTGQLPALPEPGLTTRDSWRTSYFVPSVGAPSRRSVWADVYSQAVTKASY